MGPAVLSFIFGALDQYLGGLWSSTHLGWWTVDLSQMSALWLAWPFIWGARQQNARRACASGATVTLAALLGYFVMTLSPVEGVSTSHVNAWLFAQSQAHVILPALATGPLMGWLGWRWRTPDSYLSGAVVAGMFMLEPFARQLAGKPFRSPGVDAVEIVAGFALLGLLSLEARRSDV